MRDLASFICCSSMKRIFLFTVFLRQMFKVAIISTFWIATTFCLAQRSKWHDRNCAWQFVSVTLYFFGLFQTVKKMCRDANLKKWKSGRSPTFVCLTLKVKILRSNLKNSSNIKKNYPKIQKWPKYVRKMNFMRIFWFCLEDLVTGTREREIRSVSRRLWESCHRW